MRTVLLAIEGVAGSGKSTIRNGLLTAAEAAGVRLGHVGQFSWLSLAATRAIVGLRAGNAAIKESDALAAVATDLDLHLRHNLMVALTDGHLVADRLLLSTACLLALRYDKNPDKYLILLGSVEGVRPSLTIVLTTPPEVSSSRLDNRRSARRFGDEPETIARLADLYWRAADIWRRETGTEVLVGPSQSANDADRFITAALTRLKSAETRPQATWRETCHAVAPHAPGCLGC